MKRKRMIKIISFFIIIFLVFQVVQSNITSAEGFQSHTQDSKVFLSSISINSDILFAGRQNQKTPFQNLTLKHPLSIMHQIFSFDVSIEHSFFQENPFDYRRVIRQCIPHYFNGSKYKSAYFDI